MKLNAFYFVLLLCATWTLQLGAMFKDKEDPIAKTQTDPVAYRDMIEESKDGPKGAPSPSFKLYERAGFLTDSPVAPESEEELSEKAAETLPEEQLSEDWWIEDAGDPAVPADEEKVLENDLKDVNQTSDDEK